MLVRTTHGWFTVAPDGSHTCALPPWEPSNRVAALNTAPAFTRTGVLKAPAANAARRFWESSCSAVCPEMAFPAAFATTMLVVPPPKTMVVARYLFTVLPGDEGTYGGNAPPGAFTPQS